MKVYIKEHKRHAGKWIYEGYKSAWTHLGYDTEYYSDLHDIKGDDYQLMALDGDVNFSNISKLEKANRVYLYTQPNHFPLPWGSHPNFVSTCPLNVIDVINKMDNVYKWSFGMVTDFHKKWGHVHEIPLAFDSRTHAGLVISAKGENSLAPPASNSGGIDNPTTGVIAQEVLSINPDAVTIDDSGYYLVNYGEL